MPGLRFSLRNRCSHYHFHRCGNFFLAVRLDPVSKFPSDLRYRTSWRGDYSRPTGQSLAYCMAKPLVKGRLNISKTFTVMFKLLFVGNHPNKLDLVCNTQSMRKSFQLIQIVTMFTSYYQPKLVRFFRNFCKCLNSRNETFTNSISPACPSNGKKVIRLSRRKFARRVELCIDCQCGIDWIFYRKVGSNFFTLGFRDKQVSIGQ
ncbi:hypothetical protein SAMN05660489_03909 [Pseudomonas sp. LAMO17WK12:I10]|nr:hypothetical protein H160_03997 [Pseudomonas sp. LAMO17WK12:I9]SNY41767.1 hypothetical protein SAMN05660489_03909 [Pseudomonas sp. LAMO17WK12:I10]